MENVACFDIGGTSIKYAVINETGKILLKDKFTTPKNNCSEAIPGQIIEEINNLRKNYEISKVGISSAGIIDSKNGIVVRADNFEGYSGTPICKKIESSIGLPTFIENDVNAVALGEMWMGAAEGHDNFVCISLGTGIGGAIVINGDLVRGVSGGAGEIGHIILNENGYRCACGISGCFERYASTSSLIRAYINGAKEMGIEILEINGEEIMAKVQQGEKLACRILNDFMDHLVNGIVSITHLLDPGLIVIGGGISAQGEAFFKKINEKFATSVISSYAKHTKIVQAKLQNDAGIYGACFSAIKGSQLRN